MGTGIDVSVDRCLGSEDGAGFGAVVANGTGSFSVVASGVGVIVDCVWTGPPSVPTGGTASGVHAPKTKINTTTQPTIRKLPRLRILFILILS